MSVTRKIQVRRGTATQWSTANPILSSGEFGYDTTNKVLKIGDGSTAWSSLAEAGLSETDIQDLIDTSLEDYATNADVNTAIADLADTTAENTFLEPQTFTDQRKVETSIAGAKFPFAETYTFNTFGGTCEDHVWYVDLNVAGAISSHPGFGIGIENFFISNTNQKLVEVNWDYLSIDRTVQYRPLAFSIDCDTHVATFDFKSKRSVGTRGVVTGAYLVDNIACEVVGVLSRQISNTSSSSSADTYDYIRSDGNDAVTVWGGDNGNSAYAGIDGSSGFFNIGVGDEMNENNVIRIATGSRTVDIHGLQVTTTTMNIPGDAWITSAGGDRVRCNTGGATQLRGYGSVPFSVLNGAGTTVFFVNSAGSTTFAGGVETKSGITWSDSVTSVPNWQLYKNASDTNLYFRDLINSRFHGAFVPGSTAQLALSWFLSRLEIDGTALFRSTVTCESGFVHAARTKAAVLASSVARNSGRFELSDSGQVGWVVYPDGTNWRYAHDNSIVS